jgi:hypothetical protein
MNKYAQIKAGKNRPRASKFKLRSPCKKSSLFYAPRLVRGVQEVLARSLDTAEKPRYVGSVNNLNFLALLVIITMVQSIQVE